MILHGDCREVMATLKTNSVDAIVSDPPYGLSFMGKGWDHGVPGVEFWVEALRVAKPGAHLLAFGGTRTYHRLACAIEDAGWEVRDCIAWVYGSGFPKSHDVSKAIDKAAGAEREVVGQYDRYKDGRKRNDLGPVGNLYEHGCDGRNGYCSITAPATEAAKQWAGWGTALKPAYEPIIVARKPLVGTVASNVMQYGTGGINVDGCRVGTEAIQSTHHQGDLMSGMKGNGTPLNPTYSTHIGRWPANFIHDGSDEVVGLFPETKSGDLKGQPRTENKIYGSAASTLGKPKMFRDGDSGSAARFFYCAKASKADRDGSTHPTMKPTDLMRYLCRLVTPPGGTVLDPFCGSGSTGKGAILEGFNFIGIEREAEYVEIAKARTEWASKQRQPTLFD